MPADAFWCAATRAGMILMLGTMLHAIGTSNTIAGGVCVDTNLADRGSIESTGIVTDVGLFLNLLAT